MPTNKKQTRTLTAWFMHGLSALLTPFFKRPNRVQVAALCYRGPAEKREVLLITSRGTGRWILPKGWPMDGKNAAEAARQEAWEEAGVLEGEFEPAPIGKYHAMKEMNTGGVARCVISVFAIEVQRLSDNSPKQINANANGFP